MNKYLIAFILIKLTRADPPPMFPRIAARRANRRPIPPPRIRNPPQHLRTSYFYPTKFVDAPVYLDRHEVQVPPGLPHYYPRMELSGIGYFSN